VGVVVDLDAARRAGEPEGAGEAFEKRRLAGRLGEAAAERLAGVGQRVVDEVAFLGPLRHGDLDPAAGPLRQRLGEEVLLRQGVREEDEPRHRLVVVELRDEALQHLGRLERGVRLREVAVVAPVLAGAEEEDLDRRLAASWWRAKTSASSTPRGLMPWWEETCDSAASRSR
jgi:hypothetical protein